MSLDYQFDHKRAWRDLKRVSKGVRRLPKSPRLNPCAQAVRDYQLQLAGGQKRPTVSSGGGFYGAIWPSMSPVRERKDGTYVWPWPTPKAGRGRTKAGKPRKGRGKTKGVKRSDSVGGGRGSRYKASDLLLGARAGGMWSKWLSSKPRPVSRGKLTFARIVALEKYARRQFDMRPWITLQLERYTQRRFVFHYKRYLDRLIQRELRRA